MKMDSTLHRLAAEWPFPADNLLQGYLHSVSCQEMPCPACQRSVLGVTTVFPIAPELTQVIQTVSSAMMARRILWIARPVICSA